MADLKSAIVTGGANGIGLAVVKRLSRECRRIGVLDRDAAGVRRAAESIPNGVALVADVTDEASVESAFAAFGDPLDLLVNNAGIGRFGPLLDMTLSDFRAVVEVNLIGAYVAARAAARRMVPRGAGIIVNITSLNAVASGPNAGGYPAAKAGLAKLTEQMAQEWGPSGIRVNAVAPGFIDGGISAQFYADPQVRARRSGAVPSRRLGTVDDVAEVVAFLASDQAGYINGHQLLVDGGLAGSLLSHLPRS